MINEHDLEWRWKNRHQYITFEDIPLEEKEVQYLKEVLRRLKIKPEECYLSDKHIIERAVTCYEKGVDPRVCADRLTHSNKVIMEYA